MASIDIAQAMKAIKDERCCECGKKAKGLVYREQSVFYYCKECLHKYMDKKQNSLGEAAAG